MTASSSSMKSGLRVGLASAAVTGCFAIALLAGTPSAPRKRTRCSPRSTARKSAPATWRWRKRNWDRAWRRWTRDQEGERAGLPDRHEDRLQGGRGQEDRRPRRLQDPPGLCAQPPVDGQSARGRGQGRDHRREHEEGLRGRRQADHRRAGSSRPPHPGRDRGPGQEDRGRAEEGRRFRRNRQEEIQGSRRLRRRRSRLLHQGPDGAGIFRRRLCAGAGQDFRSGEDAVRLARHQGRGKAHPQGAGLRAGQAADRNLCGAQGAGRLRRQAAPDREGRAHGQAG